MSPENRTPAGSRKPESGLAAEIRSNIEKIVEIEEIQRSNRTLGEKISHVIAGFSGTMTFVIVNATLMAGWILLNTVGGLEWDPFPFTFLTLILSIEAIFLSIFILITQNQEMRMTERRNHLDLQINMLTEKEDTKLLKMVRAIADKVGVEYDGDEVDALTEPVEPQELVEQIMEAKPGEDVEEVKPKK